MNAKYRFKNKFIDLGAWALSVVAFFLRIGGIQGEDRGRDETHEGRSRENIMAILRLTAWSAAALAASISVGHAGPCSRQIDRMQARLDAMLEARAAAGPTGRESARATMSRQPTPRSIGAAEARLGELPAQTADVVKRGMARARAADSAGDKRGCERALADVRRAIGR